ncbi:MAG: hypothetical protein O3B68_07875, partial [Planctomycetota bacterium]|nr:hypothetical protein [Planctomycetota bacterium]
TRTTPIATYRMGAAKKHKVGDDNTKTRFFSTSVVGPIMAGNLGLSGGTGTTPDVTVQLSYEGSIERIPLANGEVKRRVTLYDTADFKNGKYVGPEMEGSGKSDNVVGPFLDALSVEFANQSRDRWTVASYSPRSANKSGGYSNSKELNAGLSGGSDAIGGSAGWSQSSSSETSIFDLEFSATEPRGKGPTFTWATAQVYKTASANTPYTEPWNIVRKVAGQIAASGPSVYSAPKLAKDNFKILSQVTLDSNQPNGRDLEVLVHYKVKYRTVQTKMREDPDALGFLKGFGFVFGMNPEMYSGEAFQTWSTSTVTYEFPIKVVIPASMLE